MTSRARRPHPGRPWTPDKVRERIRVSKLVARLQQHALGEVEMKSTAIKAAEILLRKAVPDLSSVEYTGILRTQDVSQLSDAELANIAAGGSAGAAETPSGTTLN